MKKKLKRNGENTKPTRRIVVLRELEADELELVDGAASSNNTPSMRPWGWW